MLPWSSFFFFYVLALSESVEIMPSACIFHLCWHFWASAFWAVAAQLPANNSSQGGRAGRYKKKSSNRVPDRKHTSIWYHRGGGQLPVLCLQMRVILPLSKRYGCQTIKLMLNSSKAVFSVCSVTYYWEKRNIWALHCNKKWINETMSMFFWAGGGECKQSYCQLASKHTHSNPLYCPVSYYGSTAKSQVRF